MQEKINIASNILYLRKKSGMTQNELAEKLYVSNKTVSKWERGAGYPELSYLVRLSEIFGVSIDSLIANERRGIAVAGNIIIDSIKTIEDFPEKGMLVNITSISHAVGGIVPNVLIDLAEIDRTLPLTAIGRVGNDQNGKDTILELQKRGIDVSEISISQTAQTSFTDVMSMSGGAKERTFFHHRGANAEFSPEDVPLSSLRCKMLHFGYILLLDVFDREDPEYGTVLARTLKSAQELGIKTSIDVVSDNNKERFSKKVIPALRFTDNAIMNEIEACAVAGLDARDPNGKLIKENLRRAMERILGYGVRERVIVHCPEAGFLLDRSGEFAELPSLELPSDFIKGTVGAGDAFCAGCLWGIHNGASNPDILSFASGAAACSLSAADAVSGMRSAEAIKQLIKTTKRINF